MLRHLMFFIAGLSLVALSFGYENNDSKHAIAERIKPVGNVAVAKEAPATPDNAKNAPAPKTDNTPTTTSKVTLTRAQEIYTAHCKLCHDAGIAGAPKFGDKEAWNAKLKANAGNTPEEKFAAMLAQAIKGINAMPAKGTCTTCSDEELAATIHYMISNGKSISADKK
ncbi:MAG: cytochrome c5 family protein [Legionellales bacterium]|nr:cytochrome c5 family protein [Legionellales bacterium]